MKEGKIDCVSVGVRDGAFEVLVGETVSALMMEKPNDTQMGSMTTCPGD